MAHTDREKPEHLSSERAKALSRELIKEWVAKLETLYREVGLTTQSIEEGSRRIWNCDETLFATETTAKKVLTKRGVGGVYEICGGSNHEHVIVYQCGSAAGNYLRPFILYQGKNVL